MKHLNDGELQAYTDAALSPTEKSRVQAHLEGCPTCMARATALSARNSRIKFQMETLAPPPGSHPLPPAVARARFDTYLNSKKESGMLQKIFARRYRPVWGLVTLALVLTITFTFPPMRIMADRFLDLFRLEKITFVPFNPENMPNEEQINNVSPELKAMFGEAVQETSQGESHEVSLDGARAEAGFPLRVPTDWADQKFWVNPGREIKAQLDVPRLRGILQELGYTEIELTDDLNGAEITAEIPTMVEVSHNFVDPETQEINTVSFMQMRAPAVNSNSNLDIVALGKVYLQLLGMTEQEAEEFSRNIDWSSTLVIPLPLLSAVDRQTVMVDGVEGTLLQSTEEGFHYAELMWIKNGILYSLSGDLSAEEFLQIAATLQ